MRQSESMLGSIKGAFRKIGGGAVSAAGLRLSCYGKLPLYKDFIMLEPGQKGAECFKAWMDQAFETRSGAGAGTPAGIACPHRILFAPAQFKHATIAAIWDSHDADGLRKFPFAFFVSMPKKAVRRLKNGAIIGLAPVWEELESLYLTAGGLSGIAEFYERFRSSVLRPRRPVQDIGSHANDSPWQSVTVRDVATALYGDTGQPGWTYLLDRLCDTICHAREARRKVLNVALRLPLAASIDAALQIEMWMCLISHNLRYKVGLPTVYFPQGTPVENGAFSIIWRAPKREDARLLEKGAPEYEHVEDLTELPTSPGAAVMPVRSKIADMTADLLDRNSPILSFSKLNLPLDAR